MTRKTVLGSAIDLIGFEEAVERLSAWIRDGEKAKLVVTAYSEFYEAATRDSQFKVIINKADLVVPDGVGPLAAVRYAQLLEKDSGSARRVLGGFQVGLEILNSKIGETVPGVKLFERLVFEASKKGWKVYLLGGFGSTANDLASNLSKRYSGLKIEADPGAQKKEEMEGPSNDKIIEKVNKFKPDLLFVSYAPIRQEKWLWRNRSSLEARVMMGVGGTFNELTGKVKRSPLVMDRLGLRWLWRLFQEPKRLPRIWRAVVVFPWKVFLSGAD